MLLHQLVATSAQVALARKRSAKTEHLAGCIAALAADELTIGVAYLSGRLPQGKIGLGAATIHKLGKVAAAEKASLSLTAVDRCFAQMATLSGSGSVKRRKQLWLELLAEATLPEQSFLACLVVGELRQGALEALVIDALALAAEVEARQVRRATMLSGDLLQVARAAMTDGEAGLQTFCVELFRPLQPMLAQVAETPEAALQRLQRGAFEVKMDGARIQLHREGSDVRIFSRNLNDVTAALPEVVEAALALPLRSVILDGEVLACTPDGRPRPFQETMRRFGRRRGVDAARRELPLSSFFFDVLYVDGQELIDLPLSERHLALVDRIPPPLQMPRVVTADPAEAAAMFERALAVGHEGLVAKALESPYEAGSRGAAWLKLKLAHTLDLVVVAAEWGSGRRQGLLSNLHLAARDPAPDGDNFVMLGKTFKGMTDELLAWQTEQLLRIETGRDGDWLVAVEPKLVVEVAFNDVQRSTVYPGGVALRFACLRRYRPDKNPSQANTLAQVRSLLPAT